MRLLSSLLLLAGGSALELCGDITTNTELSPGENHVLTCTASVKAPNILTLRPGTTIYAGMLDDAGHASCLIIEKGAKIMAEGSVLAPITLTALGAGVATQRALWGGLIVMGNAPVAGSGHHEIQGLPSATYGGSDPHDNSGVLKYVRVWHGGGLLGEDDEIGGLTLAGVGDGTTIELVEVAFAQDDGFDIFGGTASFKYASVLFANDDAYDVSLGWASPSAPPAPPPPPPPPHLSRRRRRRARRYQGKGQFLFAMVGEHGQHAIEEDSGTTAGGL